MESGSNNRRVKKTQLYNLSTDKEEREEEPNIRDQKPACLSVWIHNQNKRIQNFEYFFHKFSVHKKSSFVLKISNTTPISLKLGHCGKQK